MCSFEYMSGRQAILAIAITLLISIAPFLLLTPPGPRVTRHLAGAMLITSLLAGERFDPYFNNLPHIKNNAAQMARTVKDRECTNAGMEAGGNHNGEYLPWVTLKEIPCFAAARRT